MSNALTSEAFPPPSLSRHESNWGRLMFRLRLLLDLRIGAIARLAGDVLPTWSGTVLDVGCGTGPWKHLLHPSCTYFGLDVPSSTSFRYDGDGMDRLVRFDGQQFPFATGAFQHILCTEVLEHVVEPGPFLAECRRITAKGGDCFLSVPFAARYHYIPHDYWRLTPAALTMLFREAGWTDIQIVPLGTDIAVAAYKITSLIARCLLGRGSSIRRVLGLFMLPAFVGFTAVGHLSTRLSWGSPDDPLGYVVTARATP